jgi:hypothetical protein
MMILAVVFLQTHEVRLDKYEEWLEVVEMENEAFIKMNDKEEENNQNIKIIEENRLMNRIKQILE